MIHVPQLHILVLLIRRIFHIFGILLRPKIQSFSLIRAGSEGRKQGLEKE